MEAVLTVGSTEFTQLVQVALSPPCLEALSALGIRRFFLQTGHSRLPSKQPVVHGLAIECCQFTDDIEQRVWEADLVISHAGALIS